MVGMSASRSTSVGNPMGCVLIPVLFSLCIQHMTTPNYGSYQLLNYANDTFLLELQSKISPSTLNSAAANLAGWFLSNELVSNEGQTKELIISNAIRQPRAVTA